jgi:hypothetical protein
MLQKREKIMAAGAGLSLVFFLFNQFVCSSSTPDSAEADASAATPVAVATQTPTATPQGDRELLESRRLRWQTEVFADWGRDPFAAGRSILELIRSDAERTADSLAAAADSAQALVLNGLLWGLGEPVALIGDAILREGESDGDLVVLKIGPDFVICRKGDKVFRLDLQGPVLPSRERPSP